MLFCLGVNAESFYQAEFMSAQQAQKKWGSAIFDPIAFKAESYKNKPTMAVGLIKKPIYVGKDMLEVKKELGDPTGYFFSDTIYAYLITDPSDKKSGVWQIVFIPDEDLKKVKEIKIHKKCCYKTPEWVK